MEHYYPTIFDGIRQAVGRGQWEIVGGSWVEYSGLLLGEESLVRQHLLGQRYFRSRFGQTARIGWFPDSFGFQWTMPQVYKNFGIKYFVTSKLRHQAKRYAPIGAFPYTDFVWRAPDGSEVLGHQSVGNYLHRYVSAGMLRHELEAMEAYHGRGQLLFLYGNGDHGGGPVRDILKAIERGRQRGDLPATCLYSQAGAYFEDLAAAATKMPMPIVADELYLATHQGTLTTEAFVKTANRRCEELLVDIERLSVIAMHLGRHYPRAELDRLWKMLLFGQVHDNIDGTSIEEVYNDAASDYADISLAGNELLGDALAAIGRQVDVSVLRGEPLLIFNTLPWEREEVVAFPEQSDGTLLADDAGVALLQQPIVNVLGERQRLCKPPLLPPSGHVIAQWLEGREPAAFKTDLAVTKESIENNYLKVEIDRQTGIVHSVFDKELGVNLLGSMGLFLRLYHDSPDDCPLGQGEPAWNLYLSEPMKLTRVAKIDLIESGPLRAAFRVTRRVGNSRMTMQVALVAGRKMVDIEFAADWHEEYRTLRMVTDLGFAADYATYEMPFGCIQRYAADLKSSPPTQTQWPDRPWEIRDQLKSEVAALRWVDISDREGKMGLLLLNDGRYGFSLSGGELGMTLLRSPSRGYDSPPKKWTDQSSIPYVGWHTVRFALCPHEGDWRSVPATRMGMNFNYTPHVTTRVGGGGGPRAREWLRVEPGNVVATAYKVAEDGGDSILRIFESRGEPTQAIISFDRPPSGVWRTDMMETGEYLGVHPVETGGSRVRLPLRPFEIATLGIRW
jgi:alpha-mannosidase